MGSDRKTPEVGDIALVSHPRCDNCGGVTCGEGAVKFSRGRHSDIKIAEPAVSLRFRSSTQGAQPTRGVTHESGLLGGRACGLGRWTAVLEPLIWRSCLCGEEIKIFKEGRDTPLLKKAGRDLSHPGFNDSDV